MQTYRLFVSSPNDAVNERRRVDRVASRLNVAYAGVARLETIRWETSFYQAFSTFQKQIPVPIECDLVVAIFRARIGTELPTDFARMPDGEAYPSGTAYEVLTAIEARQRGAELPDIYVFRYPNPPNVTLDDEVAERETRDQWERLKAFFARWFITPGGYLKAAFQTFASADDFEHQIERLLSEWLARKVAGGHLLLWPIATKGPPFPGLQAFGAKHAQVFFGRSRDTARAVGLWQEKAASGNAFLIVIGASGAGKSSLVGAGVIPSLTSPGVVAGVDAWRVAVMRPSEAGGDAFAALAGALMQDEASLPAREAESGQALPEIAEGPFKRPVQLAGLFTHADLAAVRPVLDALTRVGEKARTCEGFDRSPRVDLVLFIDQLEELFVSSVSPNARALFARLIAELVKTRRVWVATTLRADLYEFLLREPTLFALKEAGAALDLSPPGLSELAEIVRKPAEAAGLTFGKDEHTGESVDERLLRDADRPDMLPLVQLTLSRLYDARETVGSERYLTAKAYDDLGGIAGIIDRAGSEALATLGPAEAARLPRLLRLLATSARSELGARAPLTIRNVALAEAAPDDETRNLVDALIDARLLTTIGMGGSPEVRLSHQRVLTDWTTAKAIVEESADFYRVVNEVEERRSKWEAAYKRGELLLARGLPLSEAEDVLARYGGEISPQTRAFIAASRRRANRAFILTGTAAMVFAFVAVIAGWQWRVAEIERDRAERNYQAAKAVADGLNGFIYDIGQGLVSVAGLHVSTIRTTLEAVRAAVDQLGQIATDDPGLMISRARLLNNFVDTYLNAGALTGAIEAGTSAVEAARTAAARMPNDREAHRIMVISIYKLGDAKLKANDPSGAFTLYEESRRVAEELVGRYKDDIQAQRVLWVSTEKVGEAKLASGNAVEASAAFDRALTLARAFAGAKQSDPEAARDLSVSLSSVGRAKLANADGPGALAAFGEALDIRRILAKGVGGTLARRDEGLSLYDVGDARLQLGDRPGALAVYEEAIVIFRQLANADRSNARALRDVVVGLNNVGDISSQLGDGVGALEAFNESVNFLRRLASLDPENVLSQVELAGTLSKLAAFSPDAKAMYQEALRILEPLAAAGKLDAVQQGRIALIKAQLGAP